MSEDVGDLDTLAASDDAPAAAEELIALGIATRLCVQDPTNVGWRKDLDDTLALVGQRSK